MDSPPVPLPAVKSPPCKRLRNTLNTRWTFQAGSLQRFMAKDATTKNTCCLPITAWPCDSVSKKAATHLFPKSNGVHDIHKYELLRHKGGLWKGHNCWIRGSKGTWHMNEVMTRWKLLPLKCRGLPDLPTPFSPALHNVKCYSNRQPFQPGTTYEGQHVPVHKARKFSAVFGTTSARSCTSRKSEIRSTSAQQ